MPFHCHMVDLVFYGLTVLFERKQFSLMSQTLPEFLPQIIFYINEIICHELKCILIDNLYIYCQFCLSWYMYNVHVRSNAVVYINLILKKSLLLIVMVTIF